MWTWWLGWDTGVSVSDYGWYLIREIPPTTALAPSAPLDQVLSYSVPDKYFHRWSRYVYSKLVRRVGSMECTHGASQCRLPVLEKYKLRACLQRWLWPAGPWGLSQASHGPAQGVQPLLFGFLYHSEQAQIDMMFGLQLGVRLKPNCHPTKVRLCLAWESFSPAKSKKEQCKYITAICTDSFEYVIEF